ncbi:MAG: ABC transporter permease [Bryobacteraceae bacterium]|nr:ABC transporter permease [Bryobacteraceae bacterium]
MTSLLQDCRYSFRILLKSPGFTLVAVLTLAVGIAANTAVYSWIETALMRPLPGVAATDELVSFESTTPNGEFIPNCYPDYRDYRDHLKLVSGLAMAAPTAFSVGEEDRAERVWGELTSGNYFAVLGVKPLRGRVFSPDEYGDNLGGYPVAVIGENLWNRLFQRDPAVLGRTIRVNRQQLTIVGIAPASFRGSMSGLSLELWVPVVMAAELNAMPEWMLRDRQSRILFGVARLTPGVTVEQAQAEADAVARELAKANPNTNKGIGAALVPIARGHFGAQTTLRGPLTVLMAVCGLVLLIVCANVANLLLARAASRRKEFALRLALGAGRLRIARQLFVESLILAAMAAIAGAPLAMWMSQSLGYLLPPSGFPVALDVTMNGHVLAFTILLCVAASVASGLAPASHTVRADLSSALNEGGRGGSPGAQSQRLRSLLVVSEIALALVAIIGAGLFVRSFQQARRLDPGFDPRGVLVSRLYLSTAGYKVPERINFCARLRERLESQPGIDAVSYADYIPLGFADGSWEDLKIEGYAPGPSENMKIYRTVVSPGYFDVMRIPLLEGRDFTELDDREARRVMIVNQRFVQRFFNGGNPIGRKVYGWGQWFTVVGVVRDSKFYKPNEDQRPLFYVPFRQVYREDLGIAFYARAKGDPNAALAAMRREVRGLDPNVGLYDAVPLAEYISASLFAQKLAASLLGALSAIAVVLAAVGLYSVMAYSITQRTQEIGIRVALGANPRRVLGFVLRQALVIVALGTLTGIAAAAAVTRMASALLVNVSPTDPLIFAGAAAFLAVVALLAACVPALRAARIDPNVALRYQ